jgi:16S rRNA (guanine527-N7)-methyltransferase
MDEFVQAASQLHINITTEQQALFALLLSELKLWNEHTNLTAIREDVAIINKHFLDSLTLLPSIPHNTLSLVDIGTGAGFPGIPLAIMKPEMNVVLIESISKKIAFLEHSVKTLKLPNVKIIQGRAEELSQTSELRETFDVATARAVAELRTLVEYTLPFVKVGGVFIAQKSTGTEEAALAEHAIMLLGGKIQKYIPISQSTLENRQLIIISKIKTTPKEYPRGFGLAMRKPL